MHASADTEPAGASELAWQSVHVELAACTAYVLIAHEAHSVFCVEYVPGAQAEHVSADAS